MTLEFIIDCSSSRFFQRELKKRLRDLFKQRHLSYRAFADTFRLSLEEISQSLLQAVSINHSYGVQADLSLNPYPLLTLGIEPVGPYTSGLEDSPLKIVLYLLVMYYLLLPLYLTIPCISCQVLIPSKLPRSILCI